MVPLCLAYAFVCLSAWYPCRATPLEKSGFAKLLLTHLTAAVLLSTLWVQLAKGLAVVLMRWRGPASLDERLAKYIPLLWVTGVLLYLLSVTFYYILLAEQASREAQERALAGPCSGARCGAEGPAGTGESSLPVQLPALYQR